MKKFFSLLCATLLVFSASAAPVAKKAELAKKAPVAVEQMQKVQFEEAQSVKTLSLENVQLSNQLSATPALTVSNQKAQVPAILGKKVVKEAKQKAAFQAAAPAKAPQAEPIVVEIVGEPSIAPAGDVQAITVVGNDNMIYAWGVKTTSLEAGRTYAFTDMSTDYTYRCSQDYFTTYEDPTDATFSIDAEENITASIVTESGTYLVYTTAPQPEPSYEIVDVTAVNCDWADYETDMMYTLSDANGDIYQFDIYYTGSFELGHTYTYADMDKSYSCYATGGKGYAFETAEFTLTENEKGLKHIVATITVPAFNKQFNITWDQAEPQSHEVVASSFDMNDYGTDMYMGLTDADGNIFYFDVYYTGSFEFGKTYTLADMDSYYSYYKLAVGSGLSYAEASITVTEDQDGLLHVVANVVLTNGDSYTITYDEKAFEPSGVQIPLNGTELSGSYNSWYYMYIYTAKVGENEIQLAFDATAEQATYTKDQLITDYCVYASPDYSTYVEFVKAASDFTITTTEKTKTLAGSLYADNGDEYVLNLVHEKPAPVSRNVFVTDATIFTKALAAGYWTIGGKNAAKDMDINLYFISKNIEGTFTAENMDASSTWLDDSSTGTKISYQNLSAANINSAIVGDSLILEGTMTLADNNGGEANVTLHVSTPYSTETWGEWADFAPFGLNTGKFVFSAMLNNPTTQVNLPVQVREDADGNKQFKVSNWGKGIFSSTGQDLIINMDKDGFLTSVPVNLGDLIGYGDIYAEGIDSVDAKFDAENGIFPLAMSYTIPDFYGIEVGNAIETLTMDKPILERDTVEVTTDMKLLAEPAKGIIKVSAEFNDTTYILEVVGADTVGTFSLADGTLSQKYYYGIVSAAGKSDFAEGEVTIAKNETGLKLNGLMIGVDEKAYVLDWTYTPITERDTVDIISNTMTYNDFIASNQAVQFYAGEDAVGYSTFLVTSKNATSVEGTFDIYVGYSFANPDEGDQIGFEEGQFTVVAEEKGIRLTGWVIGDNEKYYRLNWYKQTVFDERDTVYVNSNTLDAFYQGSINGYVYQSSNTDYELIQFVTKSSEKLGTFAVADLQYGYSYLLVHETDQTAVLFQDGEFTVSEDEEGFKLIGTLIGVDEKAYVFNLVQPVGVLEKDTDAPFEAEFAYTEMTADIVDGVISISVQKGTDLALELVLFTDPANTEIPEGVYTISDSQEAGTALKSIGYAQGANPCFAATLVQEDKLYLDDMWFMVEGTITLSYDEYGKLKVEVDAKNSYGQPVTALVQYVKLEPKSTVDIVSTDLTYTDEWYAEYGIQEFVLTNDNYGVLLDIFADTFVGEFTEDDVDLADSYIVDFNTGVKIPVVNTGNIVVTLDGKNLALTATLIGADTIQYNISATGYLGYIQGDAVEGYVGEFSIKDVTFSQQKAKKLVTLSGINAKGDKLTIIVQGTTLNNENKLAAGTYENIQASIGWDEDNQVTPSFVGNDAGVWFIQSGKLTVAEDGSMVFEGVNSYDANVFLSITVPEYYLVGFINGSIYGIEDDIDNLGDYKFVDGKVTVTFNMTSYVQVKDNDKVIFGTEEYVVPVNEGSAIVLATGTEKIGVNAGEYEFTLNIADDDTKTLSYVAKTTGLNNVKANVKAAKRMINGQIVIVRENKEYNILGTAL